MRIFYCFARSTLLIKNIQLKIVALTEYDQFDIEGRVGVISTAQGKSESLADYGFLLLTQIIDFIQLFKLNYSFENFLWIFLRLQRAEPLFIIAGGF